MMAAKQGYAEAQCCCGAMYYTGDGVERDLDEAQKFWELAAAQGHEQAQMILVKIQSDNARG